MAQSIYPKTLATVRNVATVQHSGAGVIRLPLNRDLLTAEHQLRLSISQTGVTALATPPADLVAAVAKVIERVSIETDDGPVINAPGVAAAMLSGFTETQPTPKLSVDAAGNGAAEIVIDLHHENDQAIHDLMTALETGRLSKCDLVLQVQDAAAAGLWTAGATPGATVFDVRVQAEQYRDLTGIGEAEAIEGIDPETGEAVTDANPHYGIGQLVHRVASARKIATGAGQFDFMLQSVGNAARFLMLVVIDPATGLPVDGELTDVRLVVNGEEIRNVRFDELQASNEAKRGFRHAGVAVIDFGDDEEGFLDLGDVAEGRLFVTATGATANAEIHLVEDYTAEA